MKGATRVAALASISALAFGAVNPGVAMAQDGTGTGYQTERDVIVVTAQNRAEDVQDVPITMNVVGADALRDAGFSNAADLDKIAPSVQLNEDQGTVKITVRGVGTTSNDEAQDTSVVANIDGEYINRPQTLSIALFDLDRVEVLRGPQGTLYGRNSTGGAINFITRKPGDDFGVSGTASYGNYDAIKLDAGFDLPLGDVAAVRIAGFYQDRDGYFDHPASDTFEGGRSGDEKAWGGRATFQTEPVAGLDVTLAAEYSKREYTPASYAFVDLNAPGNEPTGDSCNNGFERVAPNIPEVVCIPSNTDFRSEIDEDSYEAPLFGLGHIEQDTYAFRGRISYEFGPDAMLTYTGGFRSFSGGKTDGSNLFTLPITFRSVNFVDEADTQSHEIRVNGELGGVVYQVGAFYFDEKLDRENGFALPIGPNGTFLTYFDRAVETESKSVFGQVEVPLTETITAIGGLRYTDNSRTGLYLTASPFGAGPPDPGLFNAGIDRKNMEDLAYVNRQALKASDDKLT